MCVADLNKPTRVLPFISSINIIVRLTFAQVQILYADFFLAWTHLLILHVLYCKHFNVKTIASISCWCTGHVPSMTLLVQGGDFGCLMSFSFLKVEPLWDQTWWDSSIFSIVICLSYVVDAKNTLVGPVGPFKSTIILTGYTPNRLFLAYFEVGLHPSCN